MSYSLDSPSLAHILYYLPEALSLRKSWALYQTLKDRPWTSFLRSDWEAYGFKEKNLSYLSLKDWSTLKADWVWAQSFGCQIVPYEHPAYPALLAQIADPPFLFFAWGDLSLASKPQIAMVGTRKPTVNGAKVAQTFASALAESGWTITSGLALGIDAHSHQGALAVGGKTIAVLGHGFGHVYPKQHQALLETIRTQGLVISEFRPEQPPTTWTFPLRNRLISGLSVATLVVEAAVKSGSLITARQALEQGREVLAVPGSIHHPQAKGCHALIKQGAKLVETVKDITEELTYWVKSEDHKNTPVNFGSKNNQNIDSHHLSVLESIGYELTTFDTILNQLSFSATVLATLLTELEMRGMITSSPFGYIRLADEGTLR